MKRAQSSMEFLAAYGWSIITIAIVLAALYGIGLFNAGASSSSGSCLAITGFVCTPPVLSSSGLLLTTIGQTGAAITITNTLCNSGSSPSAASMNPITPITLSAGQQAQVAFQCTLPSSSLGTHYTGALWIGYTNPPSPSSLISKIATVSASVTNVVASGGGSSGCAASPNTYATGGGPYSVTVPTGCTYVEMLLWGGGGGDYIDDSAGGGGAGYISGKYAVTPGATMYVYVGGGSVGLAGGVNGGGAGVGDSGGGGCSAVSTTTGAWPPSGIVILAAGGGGGGYGQAGGAAGGTKGANGIYLLGGGGGGTSGGPGGLGAYGHDSGQNGGAYVGGSDGSTDGGGGCGYYGGGGGGWSGDDYIGGGGGGASWNSVAVTNVQDLAGSTTLSGNTAISAGTGGKAASNNGNDGEVILVWSSS